MFAVLAPCQGLIIRTMIMINYKKCAMLALALSLNCSGLAFAATSDSQVAESSVSESMVVNINTADSKALQSLKGLGEKKAQAIIDYREDNGDFDSIDELSQVKGISTAMLQRLEDNNPHDIVVK